MKWNYLLPRFALAAIIWTFFAFAFDPLVRMCLVRTGQSLTGAEVDVVSLQTGFFPPSIKTGPIRIASQTNDKRNLVSFDQIKMKLSGKPLMYRNLIVEEATVSGMEFDSPRSDDDHQSENTSDKQGKGFQFSPQLFRQTSKELGNSWLSVLKKSAVEELDPNRLETVRVSKTIEQEWKQRFAQYDTRLKQVKLEVDSVQNNVKNAAGKTIDKIRTYTQSAERVDLLVRAGKQIRKDLKTLPQIAQQDYKRIEQAKEHDLANLDQLVESVSPDPQKILHALIGENLSQQLEQVLGWSNLMLQSVKTLRDEQEPEPIKGEWINFRRDSSLPDALFKKIRLTGVARVDQLKYPFIGTIKELSSSPSTYRKPIVLQAQIEAEADIKIAGELKFYEDNPTHDFVVLFKLPHQKKITIENSKQLSLDLIAEHTECKSQLSFREHDFQCQLVFTQTPVHFQVAASQSEYQAMASILTQTLASIDSISATLNCSGSYKQPEWRMESELGEKIARGLHLAFQAEISRQKQRMSQQIEQLASQEREKLIQKLNIQYSEVLAHLEEEEVKVQAVIQKVSNRPLDIRRLLR
ncbi:MAG: TIGR03545 family protein [Planctomycetes bacterium]|nr:TIGR03545 family protein [Planctomycetota bacterium]MCH9726531.1 TIGR03545 family protein [Planctomycetota bacterium]MCH9779200.1 TIGR03545 family protein [Planctomycetota bacterium]